LPSVLSKITRPLTGPAPCSWPGPASLPRSPRLCLRFLRFLRFLRTFICRVPLLPPKATPQIGEMRTPSLSVQPSLPRAFSRGGGCHWVAALNSVKGSKVVDKGGIIVLAGESGDRSVLPRSFGAAGRKVRTPKGSALSEPLPAGQGNEGRSRLLHRPGTDSATENRPPRASVRQRRRPAEQAGRRPGEGEKVG
jgi:hypothetical protein